MILAAQRVAAAAVQVLGADGATAWQTVFHFHLYVITRYQDTTLDRLMLLFEPGVPGDAEEIRAVGARLRAALT